MGIFCEIGVKSPPNNVFQPGSSVSGSIKYAFDEDTSVKRICVSLVGHGRVEVIETKGSGDDESKSYDTNEEDYVNTESTVLSEKGGKIFQVGAYKTLFNFAIPHKVPSSLHYRNKDLTYEVKCNIIYCIRIKFEFTSLFKFNKVYEREITIVSGITPKLSLEPLTYGERKKLFQLFGKKEQIIDLKACILKSVVEPQSKIKVNYEIKNDSNKTVKSVEAKLVEVYTFHRSPNNDSVLKRFAEVDYTNCKTSSIKSGETLKIPLEIMTLHNLNSLDYSRIVNRDYAVVITVELPYPHSDIVVSLPVQIGYDSDKQYDIEVAEIADETPPSYWESMNECSEKVKK